MNCLSIFANLQILIHYIKESLEILTVSIVMVVESLQFLLAFYLFLFHNKLQTKWIAQKKEKKTKHNTKRKKNKKQFGKFFCVALLFLHSAQI